MIISKKARLAVKRVLWVFIPAVVVLGLGVSLLEGYLVYRMTHPVRSALYGSPRDFQIILQKPMWSDEKWRDSDGTQSAGWFLSRGATAPAIILSHASASNRSELLTLGFELWKAGYNVLVYDLRGQGESPVNWSGLGTYEKDDLLSAINYLNSLKAEGQPLVDGRFGLYGAEIGGYASLLAASQSPGVKAVAVDSVYPDVNHYFNHLLKTSVGNNSSLGNRLADSPTVNKLTNFSMQLYLMRKEENQPGIAAVSTGSGRRYLFIAGKDSGPLAAMTRDIYDRTVDQKEFLEVERSRINRLYGKDAADYDANIVKFFQSALPTTPPVKLNPALRASR